MIENIADFIPDLANSLEQVVSLIPDKKKPLLKLIPRIDGPLWTTSGDHLSRL
jgi:hypothetical protein